MNASPEDDRTLVESAQTDPARFVELYDRYATRVYAFVTRRVRDRAAAEDITSEVFERALTHFGRYEWRGTPFVAWLFGIASNAIADHWRRHARDAHDPPGGLPDSHDDRTIERRVVLFDLVDRLPEAQRRMILMRFVEEKSIREIAQALGRSEGAVKQLQLRALDNLRKELGHHA